MPRALNPFLLVLAAFCLGVALGADQLGSFQGVVRRPPNRRPDFKGDPCPGCAKPRWNHGVKRQTPTSTPKPQQEEEKIIETQSGETQLPMDFLRRLNEIDDEREFYALIGSNDYQELVNTTHLQGVEPGDHQPRIHRAHQDVGLRFGLSEEDAPVVHTAKLVETNDERRTLIERPKQARCMPENTTVPLKQDSDAEDPFIIYFPSCTRVQRCGGCCNSDLLSCQPTEISLRSFQVITTEFKNGKFSDVRKSKIVHIEEHMKCTCDCRIRSEHCNSLQKYDERACRCKCINNDDKLKCDAENKIKLWDYDQCLCKCREVSECSTGFYFDHQTCSCKSDTLIYSRFESKPRQPGAHYNLHDPTPWEQITGLRRRE